MVNYMKVDNMQELESRAFRSYLYFIDKISILAMALIYLIGVYLIIFRGPKEWVDLVADDAYYYMGIVRGIVVNGESSFLPPFNTNGYQPLWLIILTISGFVFGTSDISLMLQIYNLSFVSVGIFAYLSKRIYGSVFPAILSATVFSSVTLSGMETAMIPPLVLAYFYSNRWQLQGIIASLLFLTRLDALAFVLARDLYKFLTKNEINFKKYLILVPIILFYFLINNYFFHSAVPISGLAKSLGRAFAENQFIFYSYIAALKSPFFLTIGLLSALLLSGSLLKYKYRYKSEVFIFLITLSVVISYYSLQSGWPGWPWYYWPEMMLFYYCLLEGINLVSDKFHLLRERKFSFLVGMGTLALISIPSIRPAADLTLWELKRVFSPGKIAETFGSKNVELVHVIKNKFVKGTFFAMGDRAGSLGFFLGRDYKFLHTEGLVGPYSYYMSMKNGLGDKFLRDNNIEYLVAERDRFFEVGSVVGVVEPVQSLSSRFGQYMICFDKSAIVVNQSYIRYGVLSQRFIFRMSEEITCPVEMINDFEIKRSQYGELRKFTLYSEY